MTIHRLLSPSVVFAFFNLVLMSIAGSSAQAPAVDVITSTAATVPTIATRRIIRFTCASLSGLASVDWPGLIRPRPLGPEVNRIRPDAGAVAYDSVHGTVRKRGFQSCAVV